MSTKTSNLLQAGAKSRKNGGIRKGKIKNGLFLWPITLFKWDCCLFLSTIVYSIDNVCTFTIGKEITGEGEDLLLVRGKSCSTSKHSNTVRNSTFCLFIVAAIMLFSILLFQLYSF
jgi:hypothetical protein